MTRPFTNTTMDIIHAIERVPSILKLEEVFGRWVERYGGSAFLCSAPPRPDEGALDPLLLDGWPREWRDRYATQNYVVRDPMVRAMFTTMQPFTWREGIARVRPSKKDLEIVAEPGAWGMCEGFVVPIFGLGGQVHAVTIAGTSLRLDAEGRAELHLVSIYAYARAKQLCRRPEPPVLLSRREVEVLQWVALGKSDWEIAQLLGLKATTVHKHVEAAKNRFGVGTRVQAIVAALRQGAIHI
jgi:LuxR family transcriptional regulator, quorum-sensing system regulator BjaR1